MRKIGFLFVILLISASSIAQKLGFPMMMPKDIPLISKRQFVVVLRDELSQEDKDKILKNDKKNGATRIEDFNTEVNHYNELILQAFKSFWHLNTEFETMTEAEMMAIKKAKTPNNKYVFAYFKRYPWIGASWQITAAPMLCLQRSEQKTGDPDFSVCFPGTPVKSITEMTALDFGLAVYIMEEYINYNKKRGVKYEYDKAIREIGKENCAKLDNQVIYVDKNYLAKGQTEEMFNKYGTMKIKLVETSEIEAAFNDKEKDVLVLLSIPYMYASSNGSLASMAMASMDASTQFSCIKFVVNVSTMEIYGSNGNNMMANRYAKVMTGDIESILKCK